jgi:AMMECR1 domain-containing protein
MLVTCLLLVACSSSVTYPQEKYWQPPNPLNLSHSDKVFLMQLAKSTVDNHFANKTMNLSDGQIPESLKNKTNKIYITFRNNGVERACYSGQENDLARTTVQATLNALGDERFGGKLVEQEADNLTIELTILYNEQKIKSKNEIELGVHAIKIDSQAGSATFIASVPIVHNYNLDYNLLRLCKKAGLPDNCYNSKGVSIYKYEVYHFISNPRFDDIQDLYRANIYFDVFDVNKKAVRESIDLAGEWMLNDMNSDGSLRYKYAPSTNDYPDENNMIRQIMGTWSLARIYTFTGEKKYLDAWHNNMEFNFNNFYVRDEEKDFGYLWFDNEAKLGSAAFALASILEIGDPEYDDEKQELINFIYYLQEPDGAFKTFYLPADRNDNQYYYPGEALLSLMILYEKTGDKEILAKVDKSFYYYREYYRNDKNPAFVPWQTQAFYKAYLATNKQEYADFIFEMNDWLVNEMLWDSLEPYPDYVGRFYSAQHPDYGPPHAASTSVYIEGLSDAYKLAKKLGQTERAEKYRNAIILGMRSIINLQYRDGTMFYLNNTELARGGIRTRETDNSIRIDNTQHTIMAFINVYESFEEKDYLFDKDFDIKS